MPFGNAFLLSLAVLTIFVPSTGFAHHGWSSYDATKTISITTPLSSVSRSNPHKVPR